MHRSKKSSIMKKIFYFTFLFAIIGISCTDLDEELYDKIPGDLYPENENQVATLSANAYKPLQPLIDDEGWWFLAQEISSDEFCGPTRATDWDDGGKWRAMHRHNWSNDTEGVNRMWEKFWKGIAVSNQTLDILRGITPSPEIDAKIAEVEVLRSFYYYLLMDNYGDIPYLTTSIGVPEKPMKIKRAAVYDSLINTVEKALPLLLDIDNKYLVTRSMGFALISKLYLNANVYKGEPAWEDAGKYLDSLFAKSYVLENNVLAPFKTDNELSSEIIFAIPLFIQSRLAPLNRISSGRSAR